MVGSSCQDLGAGSLCFASTIQRRSLSKWCLGIIYFGLAYLFNCQFKMYNLDEWAFMNTL